MHPLGMGTVHLKQSNHKHACQVYLAGMRGKLHAQESSNTCSNCLLQGHWKSLSAILIAYKSKEITDENTGHWAGTHLRQSKAFLDRLRQFLACFNTTEDW